MGCKWFYGSRCYKNCLKWVEYISELNESFKKSFNEEGWEAYILEFDIWYVKGLHNLANDLPLLPKIMAIRIFKNL